MSATYIERQAQERLRIQLGWQCPECFGAFTRERKREPHEAPRYECEECGCWWSKEA